MHVWQLVIIDGEDDVLKNELYRTRRRGIKGAEAFMNEVESVAVGSRTVFAWSHGRDQSILKDPWNVTVSRVPVQ